MVGDDHDCRNGGARLEMLLEIVSQVIKVRPRGQSPSRHPHHCCHRVLSSSIQMDGNRWNMIRANRQNKVCANADCTNDIQHCMQKL